MSYNPQNKFNFWVTNHLKKMFRLVEECLDNVSKSVLVGDSAKTTIAGSINKSDFKTGGALKKTFLPRGQVKCSLSFAPFSFFGNLFIPTFLNSDKICRPTHLHTAYFI